MKLRILALVVMVLACVVPVGCWGSTNPCDAVMPVVVTTQSQLADVQRAIAEVERSGIRDRLPEAQQKVFDSAMTKVKDGYDMAVRLNALVQSKCAQAAELQSAIASIIDGWHVVRGFLALFGGKGAPPIADPVLYSEAAGQ